MKSKTPSDSVCINTEIVLPNDTNTLGNLPNVAFQTPGGSKVLIVVNTTPDKRSFNVKFRGNTLPLSLDGGAVGTWVW